MTNQPEEEVPSSDYDLELDATFSSAAEHIVLTVTDPQLAGSSDGEAAPTVSE